MEHCRQDFSDALCDGYDPDCKSADGSASGMSRRSYECVFCKRGFTNARALGGHMNIHRKDQARATQAFPGPSHLIPNYSAVEPSKHYALMESQRGCYTSFLSAPKQSYSRRNCEVYCGNLSLRIELSRVENYEMGIADKESDEIDLELRLGQYGC